MWSGTPVSWWLEQMELDPRMIDTALHLMEAQKDG